MCPLFRALVLVIVLFFQLSNHINSFMPSLQACLFPMRLDIRIGDIILHDSTRIAGTAEITYIG
jgi:hypothetical protein